MVDGKTLLFLVLFGVLFPVVSAVENPPLEQSCRMGLDIALVMDTSGSIDSAELQDMKNALNHFINTLLPLTPTKFSIVRFSDNAEIAQGFTDNITLLEEAINGDDDEGVGGTNWEAALIAVNDAFDPDPRPTVPNLVVFASDGKPTLYSGGGGGGGLNLLALDAAIAQADALKQKGIRILVVGIGIEELDPLINISGPNVDEGGIDIDVITTDFLTMADDLSVFTLELCADGSTGSCVKNITLDNCDESGYVNYTWTGKFNWSEANIAFFEYPGEGYSLDADDGLYHYDPVGLYSICVAGGEGTAICGFATERLPFFSTTSLIISILIIFGIHYFRRD